MNDGKRQVMGESKPDENPIATIYYENGTELTGKAVTLQDGTVGVRIPGEFFTGASSRILRRRYEIRTHRNHLWSPSYYAASSGGAPLETLKQYIRNQQTPE